MQKCTPMGLDPPKSDKSDPVQVVGRELHFWSAVPLVFGPFGNKGRMSSGISPDGGKLSPLFSLGFFVGKSKFPR